MWKVLHTILALVPNQLSGTTWHLLKLISHGCKLLWNDNHFPRAGSAPFSPLRGPVGRRGQCCKCRVSLIPASQPSLAPRWLPPKSASPDHLPNCLILPGCLFHHFLPRWLHSPMYLPPPGPACPSLSILILRDSARRLLSLGSLCCLVMACLL